MLKVSSDLQRSDRSSRQTASDGRRMPLALTEDLAEEIRKAEDMTGGGAAAALKALKVSRGHALELRSVVSVAA